MRHELYTDAYRRRGMGVVFLIIAMTVLALLFAACDEPKKPLVITSDGELSGRYWVYAYTDSAGNPGEWVSHYPLDLEKGDTIK